MQQLEEICWSPILFVIPEQSLRSYALRNPICSCICTIASTTNHNTAPSKTLSVHCICAIVNRPHASLTIIHSPQPQTSASV